LTATAPVIIFCALAYWALGAMGISTIAKSMPAAVEVSKQ
jgi:hypothetical protein